MKFGHPKISVVRLPVSAIHSILWQVLVSHEACCDHSVKFEKTDGLIVTSIQMWAKQGT